MNQRTGISSDRKLILIVGSSVSAFSFLWFFFPARYVLFANHDVTLFLTTSDYLTSFLKRPGGILEYTGSFLAQFLRFRLPGALLLALLATSSFCLAIQLLHRTVKNLELLAAGVITAALFVALHNYYPHRVHHSLGLLLSILLATLVPSHVKGMRMYLGIAIPLLYLVCGGFIWFFLLIWFTRMVNMEGKFRKEWFIWGIFYPAIIVWVSGRFVFLQPFRELLLNPLPFGPEYGAVLWPFLFAGWVWLSPVLIRLLGRSGWIGRWIGRWIDRWIGGWIGGWSGRWRGISIAVMALAGSVLAISFSYNRRNAEFFRIEEFAVNEDWEGLIQFADDHPSTNLFGTFYTNLALYHQDRLCRSLFNYPQPFGRRGLCFEWDAKGEVLRRGSDFFWAIGFVNEAHHWAFESMIVDGITRRNLRRLIQTELANGNLTLAGKYIRLMDRSLFDKGLARQYARFLRNPSSIREDPELGARSGIRIREDFFADGLDLERNLKSLIENEIITKPILDYLMALYLLERRVDEIVPLLPVYLELTQEPLPVLLDETLLVYKITQREDNRTNIQVSESTMRRFEEYAGILRQYRDQKVAASMLFPKFGHTFWFYLNFSELLNY